ncbi:MAG: hypothetical protein GXO39_06095 [Thermotogae bacterium]|nr:hypothetical protein [Thermotogota bacterium]
MAQKRPESKEDLLLSLQRLLATKGDVKSVLNDLLGEIGGLKAELYNHLHALENRIDSTASSVEALLRRIESLEGQLAELSRLLHRETNLLNDLRDRIKRLDMAVLLVVILNIFLGILSVILLLKVVWGG